jgi:aspartate/glutamate racemase
MKMGKKIFGINTVRVAVDDVVRYIKELDPSITVHSIVDDSLIAEVIQNNGVNSNVLRKLCTYFVFAEQTGANLILNMCSSVGEAAEVAAKMVNIPMVKIDERMAEQACKIGNKIGVVATVTTTMGPTVRLIQKSAEKLDKRIEITQEVCVGAFEKLTRQGDRKAHNDIVIKAIREVAKDVDVVVCAQGSMHALLSELGETPVPVLTSPPLGSKHAVEVLQSMSR